MTTIQIKTTDKLENVAQALAEGEHVLGDVATRAGADLVQWAGSDCPWFTPGPRAAGLDITDFRIVEEIWS
jgi:hypothetical protein